MGKVRLIRLRRDLRTSKQLETIVGPLGDKPFVQVGLEPHETLAIEHSLRVGIQRHTRECGLVCYRHHNFATFGLKIHCVAAGDGRSS